MTIETQFKLKDLKPSLDFVKWNEEMSRHFDQDDYYKRSNPFIVWVEGLRLKMISRLIKNHIKENNLEQGRPLIVEAGCGAGHVLEEINNEIKGNKEIVGIDLLGLWLEIARKKLGSEVKLIKGFAEDLPFKDKEVDVVVCTEVLEHVIDPHVVLKELKRVVKDNGLIIVSIPNENLINKLKDIIDLFGLYKKLFPTVQKHNNWHIHCFNLRMFHEFLPEGVKIHSIIKIPFSFMPLRYILILK